MQIKAISTTFFNVGPEYAEDFNRWYDLDHVPEHDADDRDLGSLRYVAPRDLHEIAGTVTGELTKGHPEFLTIHRFNRVVAMDSADDSRETRKKDRNLARAGRFWQMGSRPYSGSWALKEAVRCAKLRVSEAAIPHLPHRGLIFALGKAPSAEGHEDALRWFRETFLPDAMALPGMLGGVRYESISVGNAGQILHIFLLEDDPAEVMPRMLRMQTYGARQGRYPAYRGVYEALAFLPYRKITPLEYNFEW